MNYAMISRFGNLQKLFRKQIKGDGREWPSMEEYRAACDNLTLERLAGTSRERGLSLVSVIRNEADILPAFLDHYRALGVERFIIVDNASTDGTIPFLTAQPDVDLYRTKDSYADALAGNMWADCLAHRLCSNRWMLRVDADELLVYQDCEKYPIPYLIQVLSHLGLKRLYAPMIDLYELEDGTYFDGRQEMLLRDHIGIHLEGGIRQRMAQHYAAAPPWLSKHPLTYYDRNTCFATIHHPYPRERNNLTCFARLLHTKISGRFAKKIAAALEEKQHCGESKEYRIYDLWARSDLRCEESCRYESPKDLVDAGLMSPVPWNIPV